MKRGRYRTVKGKKKKSVYAARRAVGLIVLIALLTGIFLGVRAAVRFIVSHRSAVGSMELDFLDSERVREIYPGVTYTVNDKGGTFELSNVEVDPLSLVSARGCSIEMVQGKMIDTSRTGEYRIVYRLSTSDSRGREVTREVTGIFMVEDNTGPQVVLAWPDMIVFTGEKFDPEMNIISVADPAEGAVKYTVESDVNSSVPGKYTVNISASDKNGHVTEASYTVTVEDFVPAAVPSDGVRKYAVKVNRAANTLTVYERDGSGEYTVPVRAMICSTGEDTPLGTYYTYDDPTDSKWDPEFPWWPLYGDVYGLFAYGIEGSTLFHSVPYFSPIRWKLEYEEFNKLGESASMGCVRLCVRDVMWIFTHCPNGTMVTFYDDAENPGPLGKPSMMKIDESSPFRGWDPTDPDDKNPWKN